MRIRDNARARARNFTDFVIAQFAPGGPVEQMIAQMQNQSVSATQAVTGSSEGDFAGQNVVRSSDSAEGASYRGSRGLRPEILERIEKQFGFDKPPVERFFTMLWNYLRFDFGQSYYRDAGVEHNVVNDTDHEVVFIETEIR